MTLKKTTILILLIASCTQKKQLDGETWGHGYYSTIERLNGHVKQIIERRTGKAELFLFTEFDRQGNMTSYITRVSSHPNPKFTMHYSYIIIHDKTGKKMHLVGINKEFGDKEFYTYDEKGHIYKHDINNTTEANYEVFKYDNSGNLTEEDCYYTMGGYVKKFTYDENHLWTKINVFSDDGRPLSTNDESEPCRILDANNNWIKTLYGRDTVYRTITYY